ncbi:MAG: primosomal protein N' [Rhodobacteraceae bacterium]|nr:primosomal protein N' [Paracoccaceae bacterium]
MAREFKSGDLVGVLPSAPIDGLLDYRVSKSGVDTGSFVLIPLGPRKVVGVVWNKGEGNFDSSKIRPIIKVLDVPGLDDNFRLFLEKVAEYNLVSLSSTLARLTRLPEPTEGPKIEKCCRWDGNLPPKTTPTREKVFEFLKPGREYLIKDVITKTGVGMDVLKRLESGGFLQFAEKLIKDEVPVFNLEDNTVELNDEQRRATDKIFRFLDQEEFSPILLKGVPGAGKTEVFLEAIARTLKEGKQVLVLLPEIALTSQIIKRFNDRFGETPFEWHSSVSKVQKRKIWRMAGEGTAQLVVGARSALFLPFSNLGLIVVDEEHDSSYKQDSGIIYNARDMAVLRASLCKANIILVSATPSLESLVNVTRGKYERVDLLSRFGDATLPDIDIIDMKGETENSGKWISGALIKEISDRLQKGEQSLLFLNRRGYAPITVCANCGNQVGCTDCDARLVEHRYFNEMICHQCGARSMVPKKCPDCHAEGMMVPLGPGIERLAEEVKSIFKQARIEVLSSDLVESPVQLKDTLEKISKGEVDIIIGTQIIAKGHNFPFLTLVAVIDADVGLQGGDFRAAERTFQIIRQVTGRSGRADIPGIALLQTWNPDHPVIQAITSNNDEAFWEEESREREVTGSPPFSQYIGVIVSGKDVDEVEGFSQALARDSKPLMDENYELYGPAPAPIARIQGRVRYRLLIKAERSLRVQRTIRKWLNQFKIPGSIRLTIDVDPQRFL